MLGDRHEAEDLTHDVFVVASRKLVQLREPERLQGVAVRRAAARGLPAIGQAVQGACHRSHRGGDA